MSFHLTMLPAADGDCLLISWGEGEGQLFHAVIDGGRAAAYPYLRERLVAISKAKEKLALYVLTHIDADHVEGALSFLNDTERPIAPDQVWFNGARHFMPKDRRSMKQGDDFSNLLDDLNWPLNTTFHGGTASTDGPQRTIDIEGLKITMLSPTPRRLAALAVKWRDWRQEIERAQAEEQQPGTRRRRPVTPIADPLIVEDLIADGETDRELANGTSIAFVAEWNERRVLLAGDAHPDVLAESIRPLAEAEGGRYRVDLFKASHHGSAKNTSRELLQLLDCRAMAVSTNGAIHGHPDPQAIARFIAFSPPGRKRLHFNYATPRSLPWLADTVVSRYCLDVRMPPDQAGVLEIDLEEPT